MAGIPKNLRTGTPLFFRLKIFCDRRVRMTTPRFLISVPEVHSLPAGATLSQKTCSSSITPISSLTTRNEDHGWKVFVVSLISSAKYGLSALLPAGSQIPDLSRSHKNWSPGAPLGGELTFHPNCAHQFVEFAPSFRDRLVFHSCRRPVRCSAKLIDEPSTA